MQYFAHATKKVNSNDSVRWQLLSDHLLQVGQLAQHYGENIGVGNMALLAGILHDAGKFNSEFQSYLKNAVEHPDDIPGQKIDHSTIGGKILVDVIRDELLNDKILKRDVQTLKRLVEIVGNAVISHHSGQGLNNFLDPEDTARKDNPDCPWEPYFRRIKIKAFKNYEQTKEAFQETMEPLLDIKAVVERAEEELRQWDDRVDRLDAPAKGERAEQASLRQERRYFLLMKYVYSCLIDADRTDTMCFETQSRPKKYDSTTIFETYAVNLNKKLEQMNQGKKSDTPINRLRQKMSLECEKFADHGIGTYYLSIPTGGGKTFASLRFALKHALSTKNGKKEQRRIIYVIPYTSIIDQNGDEIRNILNGSSTDERNIKEFHSGIIQNSHDADDNVDDLDQNQWQLVQDNWDSPIVLTTLVQFLDVFYSGSRATRRLHNLSNSVIIFDEVQNVPPKCISMFNSALDFLSKYMGTTNVLCTATQPALTHVRNKLAADDRAEMVKDLPKTVDQFRRVNLVDLTDDLWTIDRLTQFTLERKAAVGNTLVIVNTKATAKELYSQLQSVCDEGIVYHLSTSMCPAHRRQQLQIIIDRLKAHQPTICVSTQLIEAGIDISFACVIRSLAGLDSVAQAAGRCNRNGEVEQRDVYIVKLNYSEENVDRLPEIKRGGSILKRMLAQIDDPNQLFQQSKITSYFTQYYDEFKAALEYPCGTNLKLFRLMDGAGTAQQIRASVKHIDGIYQSSSKTIAKYFNVIEDLTTTVLVPFGGEGTELIATLNGAPVKPEEIRTLLKQSQQYAINVYQQTFNYLVQQGLAYPLQNGEIYALQPEAYDDKGSGLNIEGNSGASFNIF